MGSVSAGELDLSDSPATESMAGKERIRVSVRLRPLNEDELSRNDPSDWDCINKTTIAFKNTFPDRSMPSNAYTFGNPSEF